MKGTFAGSLLLLLDTVAGGASLLHSGGSNDWVQLALLIPGGIGMGLVLQRCVNNLLTGGAENFDFADWELQRPVPASTPPSPA